MRWLRHEASSTQYLIFTQGVELEGWPTDIPFQPPWTISDLRSLARLRAGLEGGSIWFRRLGFAEIAVRWNDVI